MEHQDIWSQKNPLVSVIVPVYNVKPYLKRCIDSILAQTYRNLELILVDDGSTDGSAAVCGAYKRQDHRIRVIHQPNGGLSSARNAGLDIATGAWIAFIDSDDFVAPDFIRHLLAVCRNYRTPVSECGYYCGNADTFPPAKRGKTRIRKWKFVELYTASGRKFRVCAWGKLFHRSLFKSYRFPENRINEDEDAVPRLLYEAQEIAVSSGKYYYYYERPDSITHSRWKEVNWDFWDIFGERIRFFRQRGETELVRYTQKELCIRLMLRYFDAVFYQAASSDRKRLWKEYVRNFKGIRRKRGMPWKEMLLLSLFYHMPGLSTAIVDGKRRCGF